MPMTWRRDSKACSSIDLPRRGRKSSSRRYQTQSSRWSKRQLPETVTPGWWAICASTGYLPGPRSEYSLLASRIFGKCGIPVQDLDQSEGAASSEDDCTTCAELRNAPDIALCVSTCLLYTSDAADDLLCVDL